MKKVLGLFLSLVVLAVVAIGCIPDPTLAPTTGTTQPVTTTTTTVTTTSTTVITDGPTVTETSITETVVSETSTTVTTTTITDTAVTDVSETTTATETTTTSTVTEISTTDTETTTTSTTTVDPNPPVTLRIGISAAGNTVKSVMARITYQGVDAFNSSLDGKVYTQGTLLPMWAVVAEDLNVTLVDVGASTTVSLNYDYHAGLSFANVDIIQGTVAKVNTSAASGAILDLAKYIDFVNPSASAMPNLSAFLKANPSLITSIMNNDKTIYAAPYFDGLNELEKMIMLQTDWVANLLNDDLDGNSTTISTLNVYQPFYSSGVDTKVMIPNAAGDGVVYIDKAYTGANNPIRLMNDEVNPSGDRLLDILRNHIDAVYGAEIGAGKAFANRADVFTSANAAYDADELIALMRVVKANPSKATGGAKADSTNLTIFAPRDLSASRALDVLRLMQIWGIRGIESRSEYFYFSATGVLHDARKDAAFLNGISLLNNLHTEGLIVPNYTTSPVGGSSYDWRKLKMETGELFMNYDFNASTTVYSVGAMSGYRPILPPIAVWADGGIVADDHEGVNMFQFSESSRALKADTWAIPMAAVDPAEIIISGNRHTPVAGSKLDKMIKMIDYFYSEEGNDLICYGLAPHWNDGEFNYKGELVPAFTSAALAQIADVTLPLSQGNIWDYMRNYVGATINIGYVRGLGVEYQSLNAAGKSGIDTINRAVVAGSFKIATTTASYDNEAFYLLAPSAWKLDPAISTTLAAHTLVQTVFSTTTLESSKYIILGYGNASPATKTRATIEADIVDDFLPYFMTFYRQAWQDKLLLTA